MVTLKRISCDITWEMISQRVESNTFLFKFINDWTTLLYSHSYTIESIGHLLCIPLLPTLITRPMHKHLHHRPGWPKKIYRAYPVSNRWHYKTANPNSALIHTEETDDTKRELVMASIRLRAGYERRCRLNVTLTVTRIYFTFIFSESYFSLITSLYTIPMLQAGESVRNL